MSQQAINTKYDTDDRSDKQRADGVSAPVKVGELIVGVRLDTIPAGEGDRLAADQKFHPLTIDRNGFLRVTMPNGITVKTEELEVLRETRDLMVEVRDLLMKIA